MMTIAYKQHKQTQNTVPTVLVVDDVPANLDILVHQLETENIELIIALSGEQGIELACQLNPDLILMDVMLPGIDGFETCKQLKANPRTVKIPILFLSAKSDENAIQRALSLGAIDFMEKPYSLTLLLSRLNFHIKLKRKNDQLNELILTNELAQLASCAHFFQVWKLAWHRAQENKTLLSLIIMEIAPCNGNTSSSVQANAQQLFLSATMTLIRALDRPTDLITHYRDFMLVVLLPNKPVIEAKTLAASLKKAIFEQSYNQEEKDYDGALSIHQALASTEISPNSNAEALIRESYRGLVAAKKLNNLQIVKPIETNE